MIADIDRAKGAITAEPGVYAPQHDSVLLLLHALRESSLPAGAQVLDLCTGSGILAIGAALLGAGHIVALDISADAVKCAQTNAVDSGVRIDVRQGDLSDALLAGPFDVVICNPPYVPAEPSNEHVLAWDAGIDGRLLLDPLCRNAGLLLRKGGFVLIVHSEFSGPDQSIRQLRAAGLKASVVARRTVDFGPIMQARADWLEMVGVLEKGRRREELVVIRGDREGSDGA